MNCETPRRLFSIKVLKNKAFPQEKTWQPTLTIKFLNTTQLMGDFSGLIYSIWHNYSYKHLKKPWKNVTEAYILLGLIAFGSCTELWSMEVCSDRSWLHKHMIQAWNAQCKFVLYRKTPQSPRPLSSQPARCIMNEVWGTGGSSLSVH